jgi:fibronectin type 3 domain-containing protein
VTIKSVTIAGTGFSVSGETFPKTLASGESVTLDLQFDPAEAGDATGQLTIASNSSSNPTIVVSLSGTGAAHKVKLNWDAPSSGSIAGYNIYRASGGSASYQRLNSNLASATSYTDTNVESGQTYSYVVKTVDDAGSESSPSNKTTVTIP